jgi:hypothetical protein
MIIIRCCSAAFIIPILNGKAIRSKSNLASPIGPVGRFHTQEAIVKRSLAHIFTFILIAALLVSPAASQKDEEPDRSEGSLAEPAALRAEPFSLPSLPEGLEDFSGFFSLSSWTFTNPANGSFTTQPGPPIELYITGGNSGIGGVTDLSITIPIDGLIRFRWGLTSADTAQWDSGGYVLNGI